MALPATPAPHRRRRRRRGWAIFAAATVVVLALIAGAVIWAPWRTSALLRPAGLKAGTSTTSSVTFRWANPASGPLPDSYQILSSGKVLGTVPGTVTSYRVAGLAPDTAYQYRVAALRGRGAKGWIESWRAAPQCPAGPCTVQLTGDLNRHPIKATLTRSGAAYTGTTTADVFRCGKPADSVPIRSTLTIRVTLKQAQPDGRAWVARTWAGRMVISSPYTSTSTFFCNAFKLTTSLSGSI